MRRRSLPLAIALILVAVAVPSAAAATPPSYLFAMSADGGSLKRDASGWWVTLTGTSPLVTRFADRPQRIASTVTPAQFAAQWRGYGFSADPPNAALVIADGADATDVFVVELRRPRVRGSQVVFRARPIRSASTALSRYVPRADRLREIAFGPASLFIDDASATVYQPLTLQIANAQPGQSIVVSVSPSGGIPVGFSSGPALTTASGLQLIAQGGAVPLTSLSVTANQIRIETLSSGGGGGAIAFSVPLYLAADEDIEMFMLQSLSTPGIQVTAQLGDGLAQVVNMSPTLFAWN